MVAETQIRVRLCEAEAGTGSMIFDFLYSAPIMLVVWVVIAMIRFPMPDRDIYANQQPRRDRAQQPRRNRAERE